MKLLPQWTTKSVNLTFLKIKIKYIRMKNSTKTQKKNAYNFSPNKGYTNSIPKMPITTDVITSEFMLNITSG